MAEPETPSAPDPTLEKTVSMAASQAPSSGCAADVRSPHPASENEKLFALVRRIVVWQNEAAKAMRNRTLFAERFQLQVELGKGGFGKVFRATDNKSPAGMSGQEVALKLLFIHLDDETRGIVPDSEIQPHWFENKRLTIKNWIDETQRHRKVADASNLGCVPILDSSAPESTDLDAILEHVQKQPIWLAMPVYKQTLAEYVAARDGKLHVFEARRIMLSVGHTLQRMHDFKTDRDKEVIHRDLKPANVLMNDQGNPFVADFGLATGLYEQALANNPASGTPLFMAPEQYEGKAATQRTDIWAWGVMFYWLLSGRYPFEGNLAALMRQITNDPPLSDLSNMPGIPAYLAKIVMRCLSKKLEGDEARYGSFRQVLDAIRDGEFDANRPPLQDAFDEASKNTGPSVGINDLKYRQRWLDYVQNAEAERQFDAFCNDPRPFLWWGVVGPGGVGKSRLAYELVLCLNRDGNWRAGFLRDDEDLASTWLTHTCPHWRPRSPTLIVVDYSARFSQALLTCLGTLSSQKWQEAIGGGARVRLLFLDRPGAQIAPMAIEKVFDVNSYDAKREVVRKFLFGVSSATPQRESCGQSEPIVREEELLCLGGLPRERWREVIQVSAAKAGDRTLELKPDDDRDWWTRIHRLSDGGRPLLLQILGVCFARRREFVDELAAGDEGLQGLLDEMLKHERTHRWVEAFKDHSGVDTAGDAFRAVERAIGFITLTRGIDLKRHDESMLHCAGRAWLNAKCAVGSVLKVEQKGDSWRMPPLQPDLLGERLLLNLARRVADQQPKWDEPATDPIDTDAWVGDALQVDVFGTIQTIHFLAQDFPRAPETIAWTESLLQKMEPWLDDHATGGYDQETTKGLTERIEFKRSIAVAQVVRTLAEARGHLDKPTQNLFLNRASTNLYTWFGAIAAFTNRSFSISATVLKRIDPMRWALFNANVLGADLPGAVVPLCHALNLAMAQCGEVGLLDQMSDWGARLQEVADCYPDAALIQLELAEGAVNALCSYSEADRWVEFDAWGKRLQDVADRHPDHDEVQRTLAQGAFNTILDCGLAHRWVEFDAWGKRLQDVADRHPDHDEVQTLLADGAFNAMFHCSRAARWVEFDTWGTRLRDVADRHPDHDEIQLLLAQGAVNAIMDCGLADRWVEFDAWGKRLQDVADRHPDHDEIQLLLAKGLFNAMVDFGRADRWVEFDAWGKRLQGVADRHPDHGEIQCVLAQGATLALLFILGPEKTREPWIASLETGLRRFDFMRNEFKMNVFASMVRSAVGFLDEGEARSNAVEVLVQLARFWPMFMVAVERESVPLAEFVADLPDLDSEIRRELQSLL